MASMVSISEGAVRRDVSQQQLMRTYSECPVATQAASYALNLGALDVEMGASKTRYRCVNVQIALKLHPEMLGSPSAFPRCNQRTRLDRAVADEKRLLTRCQPALHHAVVLQPGCPTDDTVTSFCVGYLSVPPSPQSFPVLRDGIERGIAPGIEGLRVGIFVYSECE